MPDGNLKLGLREPHPCTQRLQVRAFRTHLPAPPPAWDWSGGRGDWGVLGNRTAGNCGIAGPLHQVMAWVRAATGKWLEFTDQQALAEYATVTGQEGAAYDVQTGANDNGVILADVLQEWQARGLLGHQIQGWVDGQPGDLAELLWAHSQFGGALLGLALPLLARAQYEAGQPWTLRAPWSLQGRPGSWGAHCVYLVAHTPELCGLVTWGGVQFCTPEWLSYYVSEVHYPVSRDFLNSVGLAPSGLDFRGLFQSLALLGPVL